MFKLLDFRDRSKFRRVVYSKPVILVLLAILILLLEASWGMYEKSVDASDRRDKTLSTEAQYKKRDAELSNDINRLSTERGIEEEIRTRYMVAKDGENVIIVRTPEEKVGGGNTIVVPAENKTLMQRMLGAMGMIGN
jgi:cell division protein FtsB